MINKLIYLTSSSDKIMEYANIIIIILVSLMLVVIAGLLFYKD